MAVLIGSGALRNRIPRFPRQGDYDIVLTKEEFDNWSINKSNITNNGNKIRIEGLDKPIECEFEDLESNKFILNRTYDKSVTIFGLDCYIADLNVLLALKHSHRYYSNNWHKNIRDYSFLKSVASLTPELLQFSDLRQSEKNGQPFSRSLNVYNDDFFEKSQGQVKRKYIHDDLHYATCYYDEPLWMKCKQDIQKAAVDERLFNLLDYSDRVKMVQEEGFVIALERKIIPYLDKEIDAKSAFMWAIMRIGTNLTSGWFRDFTIDNYVNVVKYNYDYVGKFKKALTNGKIRQTLDESK